MTSHRASGFSAAAIAGTLVLAACGTSSGGALSPTATTTSATSPTGTGSPALPPPSATLPVGTGSVGPSATPSAATPSSPTSAAPTSATSSTPGSPPAASGTAGGCAPTSAAIPAHAAQRRTIDVDGDGRPDTEWVSSSPGGAIRIGIRTASGATFSAPWQSASPVERVVLVARPGPGAQPVVLADDGRMVGLFTVLDCAIRPVTNLQGAQYSFDLGDAGTGTGVGCLGPGDAVGLTGLNLNLATTDHTHYAITRTFVNVHGTRAANGLRDTLHVTLPAGQAAVDSAFAVTCGTLTMKRDGLVAP